MTDGPREIEAKFTVDDDGRARLAAIASAGEFGVVSRSTADQDDLYFDTEDRLLAGMGATLRVRRTPTRALMTFKGPRQVSEQPGESHIANRLEDEVEIEREYADAAGESAALPERAGLSPLDRAVAMAGGRALLPVARIENRRTTIVLRDASGHEAELALDSCRGTRFADGRVVEFDEVELEARGIDSSAVRDLAEQLQETAPGLRPSTVTKLERVLGDG